MIRYEQWRSAGDLRVCDRCRALHGQVFRAGEGPRPPLHPDCRCWRAYHHYALEPGDTAPLLPPATPGPTPDWQRPFYERPGMQIETRELDPVDWLLWLLAIQTLIDSLKLWEDALDPVTIRNQPHSQEPKAGD